MRKTECFCYLLGRNVNRTNKRKIYMQGNLLRG
uniref:Uncharacterized protein n=1 Tax=Anguilla anguilla TaxID=7936 RepID=A0A0E9VLV4_ANGAN